MGRFDELISPLRAKFEAVTPHLNERQCRLLYAAEARQLGHGGIAAVARAANLHQGGPVLGKGSFACETPSGLPENVEGSALKDFPTHCFFTHIAEVEVDEETGQVEVLRSVCAHDLGRPINRGGLEGQIEGGVAQGIGYALIEEMVFEEGTITNGTLVDYKIPNILDVPPLEYHFVEGEDPFGPYGARGVGEAVLVPVAAAIANGIYDALGVRVTELPIRPERVLGALRCV